MARTDRLHENLTLAGARDERDAVLAALADAEWLDHAGTAGLDTREMALLDDLGALDALLSESRRSA
ncbi:hypothetical protein [Ruania alba]|uniref:Uncharacterized protein n=1 Tax=Ruania alba TaxID=648782 RepID=A0A1H5M8R2_9MICO|nr:hypothetical protein [Ruania alba]SEE85177.1 hypothetical protein SAMN04488554_3193 [Ruania alba]